MTTKASPSSLAARVARAVVVERKRRGWRAADLAEAMGVSTSRINHIESARDNPTRATLDRLVDVLGADALPDEASDPTPLMTPNWATEGVRGKRVEGTHYHATPRGVVTVAKIEGRGSANGAGRIGYEVKRYPCERCDATVDLDRDEALPRGWTTRLWRTRYGALATAYICAGCVAVADDEDGGLK